MSSTIVYKDASGASIQFNTKKEFILYKEGLDKAKPSYLRREAPIIAYPSSLSEFEIQAYLYGELRKLKYDVRGEVTSKTKSGEGCKFDLVIYRKKKAIRIIEVKKSDATKDSRQRDKYCQFKVPVQYIVGIEQAREYINTAHFMKHVKNKKRKNGKRQ